MFIKTPKTLAEANGHPIVRAEKRIFWSKGHHGARLLNVRPVCLASANWERSCDNHAFVIFPAGTLVNASMREQTDEKASRGTSLTAWLRRASLCAHVVAGT